MMADRAAEHNADAKYGRLKTPWGIHYQAKHADVKINSNDSAISAVTILAHESDHATRKLREAVEIRHRKPEINITTGWTLL